MKNIFIFRVVFLVLLSAMAPVCNAIVVYTDFNGDQSHDANFNLTPGSHSVSVYVALTADEFSAHGGLGGFAVNFNGGGANITGASDTDKANNISIDPMWDFVPTKTINGTDRAEIIGNTLNFPSFTTSPLHLFDVDLLFTLAPGSHSVQLTDVLGSSFVADDFHVYDPDVVFAGTNVNVIPLPAGGWLFLSALFFLGKQARKV